jgi:AcrR family transcriptional regulator
MTELKSRGRHRSDESERAILTATLHLLKQQPLRDITIEAIAREAGVGKVTIYRWWPSKAYVALDAFSKTMNKTISVPDTGNGENDLVELLRLTMNFYSSTGQMFSEFLAECKNDPQFAIVFRERFLKPRREASREVLERSINRGEIDSAVDREVVLDMIFGPMVFRLMAGHGPLNRKEATTMISTLFRGIENRSSKAP